MNQPMGYLAPGLFASALGFFGLRVTSWATPQNAPPPSFEFFFRAWGKTIVAEGFAALETMPDWYQYTLGVIVAASFGVRSATKFFRK